MSCPRRGSGFALLLTLMLVLIAGVALAVTARQSTGEALRTREATEELQRRWARVSCQSTLLPRAEGLITKAERGQFEDGAQAIGRGRSAGPMNHLRVACVLAGIDTTLIITDEQAKYNPSVMMQLGDESSVRSDLRSLLGNARRSDPDTIFVQLRPMTGLSIDGTAKEPVEDGEPLVAQFGGYGQLFNRVEPGTLLGSARDPGVAARVTCWSDGRLNLRRAPDAVVRHVLGSALSDEAMLQLIHARDEMPTMPSKDWFNTLNNVDPSAKALAQAMVTERSQCHGLWVVAESRGRTWTSLSIRVNQPEAQASTTQARPAQPTPPDAKQASEGMVDDPPDPIQRYDFAW